MNIIEIRFKKQYKQCIVISMKSKHSIVKYFTLFTKLNKLNLPNANLKGKLSLLPSMSSSLRIINLRYDLKLFLIYYFIIIIYYKL